MNLSYHSVRLHLDHRGRCMFTSPHSRHCSPHSQPVHITLAFCAFTPARTHVPTFVFPIHTRYKSPNAQICAGARSRCRAVQSGVGQLVGRGRTGAAFESAHINKHAGSRVVHDASLCYSRAHCQGLCANAELPVSFRRCFYTAHCPPALHYISACYPQLLPVHVCEASVSKA